MNRQVLIASLVATTAAALALASAAAVAAKPTKPGGGTANQCAGADTRGFPSFVFTRQATINGVNTWGIYVADDDATCEKLVGSYPFSRTVDMRYDPGTTTGVLVHDSNGYGLVAAIISVAFTADGSPVVQASAFQTLLAVSDVPDPNLAGWGPVQYIGSPVVSPDGTEILFRGTDHSTYESVIWACPLDSAAAMINASACRVIHRAVLPTSASWGARPGIIYVTQPALSGSGNSLYRLTLATNSFEELWSRGTLLIGAKATLNSDVERVALYEPELPSGCSRVLVINADSCASNSCDVLNGAGHPARSLTWLPNARLGGEGQTAPSRKGKCSAAGTIVTFDATDTSGTTTTLNQGFYPNGSGGG